MIIDLSEWTEYLGDDCGAPPLETELEYMSINFATALREKEDDLSPGNWKIVDRESILYRTFWRIKK